MLKLNFLLLILFFTFVGCSSCKKENKNSFEENASRDTLDFPRKVAEINFSFDSASVKR